MREKGVVSQGVQKRLNVYKLARKFVDREIGWWLLFGSHSRRAGPQSWSNSRMYFQNVLPSSESGERQDVPCGRQNVERTKNISENCFVFVLRKKGSVTK